MGRVTTLVSVLAFIASGSAIADEGPTAILGKNEWLFYKYEFADPSSEVAIQNTIGLIKSFEGVLASHGIQLTVAMVPIKMRVYSDFLPDGVKFNDYTRTNYERMLASLKSSGVNAADLNTAFMTSNHRVGDTPLFFRLDSHWTPTGAMTGAEAIKRGMESDPRSAGPLSTIASVAYSIKVADKKRASKGRDLVNQLPQNALKFEPEMVAPVSVARVNKRQADLLGDQDAPDIGLVGSSYTDNWTGFADALRYVLQRELVVVSVPATQGAWIGMENYLRDDSFQAKRPKLLIWEMPERDMHAGPDHKYRETRYISSSADWLKRVTELIKKSAPNHTR